MAQADRPATAEGKGLPRLSLIVPTLNEAGNLRHLVRRIDRALRGIPHELIVVDDASTDGTGRIADELAAVRPDLRVLHRDIVSRGLSSAILTGFNAARGEVLAVIDADADSQHDLAVLPSSPRSTTPPNRAYAEVRSAPILDIGGFRVGLGLRWWRRAEKRGLRCFGTPQ